MRMKKGPIVVSRRSRRTATAPTKSKKARRLAWKLIDALTAGEMTNESVRLVNQLTKYVTCEPVWPLDARA